MKDTGDLQNLREQERLKEQRKQAYNVGDAETVEKNQHVVRHRRAHEGGDDAIVESEC